MNLRRSSTYFRCHSIPDLRFEDQTLTSFAGLVVFQKLFDRLNLKHRLRECFTHLPARSVYGLARVTLQLIVHLLLLFIVVSVPALAWPAVAEAALHHAAEWAAQDVGLLSEGAQHHIEQAARKDRRAVGFPA